MTNTREIRIGYHAGAWLDKFNGRYRVPPGFSKALFTREQCHCATKIAVETFTAAVNHGSTFQDALLTIYLTGLENGATIERERGVK